MSDTRKYINDEVEVTLKVKVKFTDMLFYGERTEEQLAHELQSAKKNLEIELLKKLVDDYSYEELGDSKWGYVKYNYGVEPIKQSENITIDPKLAKGRRAKVNFASAMDFPDLREKELIIISVDEAGMCEVLVDGGRYKHRLGLRGELILVD